MGLLAVTTVIGLLGVVVLTYLRPPSRATSGAREARPKQDEAATLRAELTAVQRDLQLMRAQLAGLNDHVVSQPAALPAAAEDQRPAPEEVPSPRPSPPTPPDMGALEARYTELMAAEPIDPGWARPQQTAIEDFVTRVAPDAKIEVLECRSSMCRLRVKLSDAEGLTAFRYRVGEAPLDRGGFFRMDPDAHTFSYFTPRAGRSLPELPEVEN